MPTFKDKQIYVGTTPIYLPEKPTPMSVIPVTGGFSVNPPVQPLAAAIVTADNALPNVKGAWVALGPALVSDANYIELITGASNVNGADNNGLMDIAAGVGAPTNILIADMAVGAAVGVTRHCPIRVYAGETIYARYQCATMLTSGVAGRVIATRFMAWDSEFNPSLDALVRLTTPNYATSRGLDLSVSGTNNVPGPWTVVTNSSPNNFVAVLLCPQYTNGAATLAIQLGRGASGSEQVIPEADSLFVGSTSEALTWYQPALKAFDIQIGERIVARAIRGGAGFTGINISVHGVAA